MIKEYSFYRLINDFIIEVPIIQRDYAQGRMLPNVSFIRERFVTDLVTHVIASKNMHLGFVYGKIEGRDKLKKMQMHKKAVETLLGTVTQYANQFQIDVATKISTENIEQNHRLRFIPLDGQQRLTTLFVLFWYLNMRKGDTDNNWVNNFKYNNRKSAVAFFETLGNPEIIKQISTDLSDNLDAQIKSYTWYLNKWSYDATVSGVLIMLQAIHEEFKLYPDFKFEEISPEEINFSFDFLDLDELAQTDELYIKMNERGKLLTDFEHFKAWLQDYSFKKYKSAEQQVFLKQFWEKLDTVWLDFFWEKINSDYTALDDFFFNYLKTMAITYHLANYKDKEIPEFLKSILSEIRNTEIYEKERLKYIPISKFVHRIKHENKDDEVFELFSLEALQFIDHSFAVIRLHQTHLDLNELVGDKIRYPFCTNNILDSYLKNEQFTINLWDHVMYFAILIYHKKNGSINRDHYRDWLRITRNIIYNTYVQNPENLYNALHSIKELSDKYLDNFEQELLSNYVIIDSFELKFFNTSQIKEEKLKAELSVDPNWKNEIEMLEYHPYFYGQIGFVFQMIENDENNFDIKLFKEYTKVLVELFQKDTKDFLLQRALLTVGDYLLRLSSNYSFCKTETNSLRNRNENWRKVFSVEEKLSMLKKLVERILEQKDTDIETALNTIIKSHNYTIEDWEYYFIESAYPIQNCKLLEVRWNKNDDVRLLQTKSTLGYYLELRTIYLLKYLHQKLNSFEPFSNPKFLWEKNNNGHPGIILQNLKIEEELYCLEIRYEFDNPLNYQLKFKEYSKPPKPITNKIEQKLLDLGYINDTETSQIITVHFNDIVIKIKSTISTFLILQKLSVLNGSVEIEK